MRTVQWTHLGVRIPKGSRLVQIHDTEFGVKAQLLYDLWYGPNGLEVGFENPDGEVLDSAFCARPPVVHYREQCDQTGVCGGDCAYKTQE